MKYKQKSAEGLTRREILKGGLYGSLATALSPSLWLSGCGKQRHVQKPNIILIVVDTLRTDHVGCYGYHRNITPNIDKLAQEGILFRNAISSAPWTAPSVATMLTSQYPCVLGIRNHCVVIDSRFPLISEVLKQHGYATHGIVSHAFLSANLGFAKGYDSYDEGPASSHGGISSPAVTYKAVSFLQKKHEEPFFLFAHYFDPHYNFRLHGEYNYYPSYKGAVRDNHPILPLRQIRHSLSKDDIKYLLALYDSEIAFTDAHIGQLLDELKKQGLYEDSIIIITSDHGEEFMERGWIGHSITLYQELIHVPLIMKLPRCKARIIDSPVGLIDIAPTIYQYMGLKTPDGSEGKPLDISPHASITTRPIFSETFKTALLGDRIEKIVVPIIAFRSIISGNSKLIYDEKKDLEQIYDLSEDPDERSNLAGQHGTQNKRLKALLSEWIDYVEAKQKRGPTQSEKELFTPEQRKQLESLGYLRSSP